MYYYSDLELLYCSESYVSYAQIPVTQAFVRE